MKNLLVLVIILFSMGTNAQNEQAEPPKIAIKVPLESSVVVKGVTIKFLEVIEDSRCPKDVNCIWAGRAIVKVQVEANGEKSEKKIILGATRPGENKSQVLYSGKDFMLNGLTLDPYPTAASSERSEYTLLISEEKVK